MKKYILFLISALLIDIIISNLIFKNTKYWKNNTWEKKWWRVSSSIYHHDILPNIDQIEIWGEKIKQRFVELNFRSMVNEKSWEKYKKTFEGILNEGCFK